MEKKFFYRYILKNDYSDIEIYDSIDKVCNQLYAKKRIQLKQIPDDLEQETLMKSFFIDKDTGTKIVLTIDYSLKMMYLDLSSYEENIFDSTQEIIEEKLLINSLADLTEINLKEIEETPEALLKIAIGTSFLTPFPKKVKDFLEVNIHHKENEIQKLSLVAIYNTLRKEFIPCLKQKIENTQETNFKESIKTVINELEKSTLEEELMKLTVRNNKTNM
ncbi:hypothetical protein T190115A13A_20101 [Tenacibaculum sp. 190524A02b]|uniref:Uncharacterized protein n=1 Tax=Tenacibaculum vairaonense TaxID=3137860 RepID=A0ABM9PMH3_9FLAO